MTKYNSMNPLFVALFCILMVPLSYGQSVPKSWGEFNISTKVDFNGVSLKFDWLRENMSVKINDEGYIFTIGGEDLLVEYKADMTDKAFKLQKVVTGKEYVDPAKEKKQREKGVPIQGRDLEALENLVNDFVDLVSVTYKLSEKFGGGFSDEEYSKGIGIELYGKGNAYAGQFNNGDRNGRGTYIFGGNYMITGTFKDGVQDGNFEYVDNEGNKGHGKYVNGQTEGLWKYTYADGSKEKKYFKKGQLVEGPMESQYPLKEKLTCTLVEDMKTGQAKPGKGFWMTQHGDSYRFNFSTGGMGGWISYTCQLVDVKTNGGKRIETYKYTSKDGKTTSTPTLTFYDKRQTKNKEQYTIVLHLSTEKFDKSYYVLYDDAAVAAAKAEKEKKQKEAARKESAMYSDLAKEAKDIIAAAPSQFKGLWKPGKYLYGNTHSKLPYFEKDGMVLDEPDRGGVINISFEKNTFVDYIGDDVEKMVAALDKALLPQYQRCLNEECGIADRPKAGNIYDTQMKAPNKVYIWKRPSDKDMKTGKNGTIVLFYNYKKQSINLSFHALYPSSLSK